MAGDTDSPDGHHGDQQQHKRMEHKCRLITPILKSTTTISQLTRYAMILSDAIQASHSYRQPYNTPPMYQQPNINVTVVNTNNSTPLIVELLLSIFLGIYGVGWLMAGETAVGIVLIACSLIIYLPLFILSVFVAFFTFGL